MRSTETDALIVGAGAAGTMLSLELARQGVSFRTIDRLASPATTSKAITVHARTLEILERIHPALAQRFIDRGIQNKGYVLHFVDAEGPAQRSPTRPRLHDGRFEVFISARTPTERDRAVPARAHGRALRAQAGMGGGMY